MVLSRQAADKVAGSSSLGMEKVAPFPNLPDKEAALSQRMDYA